MAIVVKVDISDLGKLGTLCKKSIERNEHMGFADGINNGPASIIAYVICLIQRIFSRDSLWFLKSFEDFPSFPHRLAVYIRVLETRRRLHVHRTPFLKMRSSARAFSIV